MKHVRYLSTAALLCILGGAAPAYPRQDNSGDKQGKTENQDQTEKQPDKQAPAKPKPQQDRNKQQRDQQQQDQNQQRQARQQQDQNRQQEQAQQQQEQNQRRQARQQQDQNRQQEQAQQQQEQNQQRQAQQQQPGRLSQERQQQLIVQQQQRTTQYRQHLDQQRQLEQPRIELLQQQKRTAQYSVELQYVERRRQQRLRIDNDRHDYDHNPYYYTAPSFRYYRGGSYYEINQYGADLLRQAVNFGYSEGFQAGQADRRDRWRSSYQDSYAYQDANYGYDGYYVDQADYNFYFREGFRRGYEDGFSRRYQYGRYSNGSYSILGAIVVDILRLESLH